MTITPIRDLKPKPITPTPVAMTVKQLAVGDALPLRDLVYRGDWVCNVTQVSDETGTFGTVIFVPSTLALKLFPNV